VQKRGRGWWPADSVNADRYCDASFTQLRRPLPGAAKTRLPDAVPLHPAACPAGPWRRRQGSGDPRPAPPTHGAGPPDGSAQDRAHRPSPARRHQPCLAPIPLVLFLCQAGDAAALAPMPGGRRMDLPAPPARPTSAGRGRATADHPPGQGEPSLGRPADQGRTPAPRRLVYQRPRSGRCCAGTGWTRRHGGRLRPGGRSCASKPTGSSRDFFTVDPVWLRRR